MGEEKVIYPSAAPPIFTKPSVSIVRTASDWVQMSPEVDPLRGIEETADELIFYDLVSLLRTRFSILFRNGFI